MNRPSRKRQVRFTPEHDIKLLREVAAQNLFATHSKWTTIATKLTGDTFEIYARRARERTNLLMAKFRSEDKESRRQSGVDEDYDERMILLQEVSDLHEEEQTKTQKQKESKAKDEDVTKEMRKRALEGMERKDEATCSKKNKSNILDFLKEKQEKEFTLKKSELALRK